MSQRKHCRGDRPIRRFRKSGVQESPLPSLWDGVAAGMPSLGGDCPHCSRLFDPTNREWHFQTIQRRRESHEQSRHGSGGPSIELVAYIARRHCCFERAIGLDWCHGEAEDSWEEEIILTFGDLHY